MTVSSPTEVCVKFSESKEVKLVQYGGNLEEMILQAKKLLVDMYSATTLDKSVND